MSLKCRCGSDDSLKRVDGVMVNNKDGNPHICIGESTQTDESLKRKQGEIRQEKPNRVTGFDPVLSDFAKHECDRLQQIERTLIDVDSEFASNPAKLGMYVKLIYNKMV